MQGLQLWIHLARVMAGLAIDLGRFLRASVRSQAALACRPQKLHPTLPPSGTVSGKLRNMLCDGVDPLGLIGGINHAHANA